MPMESHYAFAKFVEAEPPLEFERIDTRLYFQAASKRTEDGGTCVGSFWLQNPGSARYASATQPCGELAPVKTDPLMKHLRNVLLAIPEDLVPDDAYVELLNVHYFSDVRGGLKGRAIVGEIPRTELCKRAISACSRFLVLGLGKGWAAEFAPNVADAIVARGREISIITPDGHQADHEGFEVSRELWRPDHGAPTIASSIFANPIGASAKWKEAYVRDVAAAIGDSLR